MCRDITSNVNILYEYFWNNFLYRAWKDFDREEGKEKERDEARRTKRKTSEG